MNVAHIMKKSSSSVINDNTNLLRSRLEVMSFVRAEVV